MAEIVETDFVEKPRRALRFDRLLPVLFRPASAMREIAREEGASWLLPVLLLSLLALISVLVGGPLRIQAALNKPPQLPPDFQYYAPEQQQKILEASKPDTSATIMYVFPAVAELGGVWVGWFLLGAFVHLSLTLSGGRGTMSRDLNLAAWSSLPIAVRWIVRILAMLITQQLITRPGLSGFIPTESGRLLALVSALLAMFDVYLIWQVILLAIGASAGSGLSKVKSVAAVLVAIIVLLALAALPAFLIAQLSTLMSGQSLF
jgi:hypothetical protein